MRTLLLISVSLLFACGGDGPAYSLEVEVGGTGVVRSDPAGIDCGQSCFAEFPPADRVTLVAVPLDGAVFGGWSGDCAGTGPCVIEVSGNHRVSASFVPRTQELLVTVEGEGTVVSEPAGIDCGLRCASRFPQDSQVLLTARPAAGMRLTGWTGDCSGTSSSCPVKLDRPRSAKAIFTHE